MSDVKETEQGYQFSKFHLNECLQKLAQSVIAREKHNYESYSMFYENLLRVHHQLLYQKEQVGFILIFHHLSIKPYKILSYEIHQVLFYLDIQYIILP